MRHARLLRPLPIVPINFNHSFVLRTQLEPAEPGAITHRRIVPTNGGARFAQSSLNNRFAFSRPIFSRSLSPISAASNHALASSIDSNG